MGDFDYIDLDTSQVDENKIKKYLFDEAEEAYQQELEISRRATALKYVGDAANTYVPDNYIGSATSPKDDVESMEYLPGEHKGYGM